MQALPHIDYDDHPGYRRFLKPNADLHAQALATVAPLIEDKRQILEAGQPIFTTRATSARDAAADQLARDGAVGMRLPAAALARMRTVLEPMTRTLEERVAAIRAAGERLKFRDSEIVLGLTGRWSEGCEEAGLVINEVIRSAGVIEIAESYYPGCRAKPHTLSVRLNTERQEFFTNVFRADNLPDPRTSGMHIDSSALPCLNGVIYLNEVGPEQGPFHYVAGSNHWAFDLEDRAIRKAVDEAGIDTGGGRRLFGQLPPNLKRKANFGFDVQDGTDTSAALLEREKQFCSDVCDMALFDSDGVHRGGDVKQGVRSSILFIMKIQQIR